MVSVDVPGFLPAECFDRTLGNIENALGLGADEGVLTVDLFQTGTTSIPFSASIWKARNWALA